MSYSLFQSMVAGAAQRPQIWRLVAGIVTVFGFALGWTAATFLLAEQYLGVVFFAAPGGDSPTETLLFLSTVAGGLGLGTWAAAWLWHGRGLGSLIGRAPRALRDFATAMLATWSIAAVGWLIYVPFSEPLEPHLPFADWVRWLPLALPVILLQTGAEELFFRGYLQSQLAARFRRIWVWLLLPSLFFGALHYVPGDATGPGLVYVASTALFGVIAADLTARTGSIGAAWGVHFANNCLAILVVVYLGAASGLGLFSAGTIDDALTLSPLLVVDLFVLVVLWLIVRRLVTR